MNAVALYRPLVLVLDPPDHAADLVQRWLMDAGFRIQACSTELLPLTVARMAARPDVVFSHGGGASLHMLRMELPGVPVVVLTTDPGQPPRNLERGAHDYVPQPVDRVRLVTSVRNAVENSRLRAQLQDLQRTGPANDQSARDPRSLALSRRQSGGRAVTPAVFGPPMTLEELERWAIEVAMDRTGGNVTAVTRELGIGRTTLYRKLKQYGLR